MAATVDDAGRIKVAPSGSSMPSDLAAMIAQSMSGTSGGGAAAADTIPPLRIKLREGPASREVRTEGLGWRTMETGNAQTVTTMTQAINTFYAMDEEYRDAIQKKMWYYGLIDTPNNIASAVKVWGAAVELAAGFAGAGKDADPIDMFQRMTNLKAGQLGDQPRTQTSRSFRKFDPESAKTWIRQAFQESMGRDPHDAEVRQLIGQLQSGFKSNPGVTTTTTDADGNQTSTTDPGFDVDSFIAEQMNADPEAAAHQAAGTLYPALMQAIASPV